VIRERIGQVALRAYPPAVREARGQEMLGMLLDAGEHSSLAFVRESGSVVLGGLRERGAITGRAGSRRSPRSADSRRSSLTAHSAYTFNSWDF
jgi:hypothetical protein